MSFNWLALTGRKYSLVIFAMIVSTVALFTGNCTFIQWGAYTTTVLTGYGIINHQVKKLNAKDWYERDSQKVGWIESKGKSI